MKGEEHEAMEAMEKSCKLNNMLNETEKQSEVKYLLRIADDLHKQNKFPETLIYLRRAVEGLRQSGGTGHYLIVVVLLKMLDILRFKAVADELGMPTAIQIFNELESFVNTVQNLEDRVILVKECFKAFSRDQATEHLGIRLYERIM